MGLRVVPSPGAAGHPPRGQSKPGGRARRGAADAQHGSPGGGRIGDRNRELQRAAVGTCQGGLGGLKRDRCLGCGNGYHSKPMKCHGGINMPWKPTILGLWKFWLIAKSDYHGDTEMGIGIYIYIYIYIYTYIYICIVDISILSINQLSGGITGLNGKIMKHAGELDGFGEALALMIGGISPLHPPRKLG